MSRLRQVIRKMIVVLSTLSLGKIKMFYTLYVSKVLVCEGRCE